MTRTCGIVISVGFLLPVMLTGSKTAYAKEKPIPDTYVPKRDYEKLKAEVDDLKSLVQMLLKKEGAAGKIPAPSTSLASTTSGDSIGARSNSGAEQPAETQTTSVNGKLAQNAQNAQSTKSTQGNMQAVNKELSEGDRKKEAEEARRRLDEFLRTQKQLSATGEIETELGISYSRDTADNWITSKLITNYANVALRLRYGVTDNLQFNLQAPFAYVEQKSDFTPVTVADERQILSSGDKTGVGDIGFGLRYAAWREDGSLPDITINMNAKSDTGDAIQGLGSGYWNAGGGVTLVKTIDPVVLFGSLGYTWAFEKDGNHPGDQIPHSIGMGFSLNDRISFSTSLSGTYLRDTSFHGREAPGSSGLVESLQFATTVQIAKNWFVEPYVGFGLTDEATDFTVGVNMPYRLEGHYPLPLVNAFGAMNN